MDVYIYMNHFSEICAPKNASKKWEGRQTGCSP